MLLLLLLVMVRNCNLTDHKSRPEVPTPVMMKILGMRPAAAAKNESFCCLSSVPPRGGGAFEAMRSVQKMNRGGRPFLPEH